MWIGDGAVLDASGQAVVMLDARGQRFGQAQAGGTILLGGAGGLDASSPESTYAQVIVRPGALLDAAGASAAVDVVPGTEVGSTIAQASGPVVLSGAGGTIGVRSYFGVALDGTMLAGGAGPGAAGGTLEMRLDPETLNVFYDVPATYFQPSQIFISQDAVAVQPGWRGWPPATRRSSPPCAWAASPSSRSMPAASMRSTSTPRTRSSSTAMSI